MQINNKFATRSLTRVERARKIRGVPYMRLGYRKRNIKDQRAGFELPWQEKMIPQGRRGFNSRANFAGDKKSRACRVRQERERKKSRNARVRFEGLGKVIRMLRDQCRRRVWRRPVKTNYSDLKFHLLADHLLHQSSTLHAVFSLVGYDHSPRSFRAALRRLLRRWQEKRK